MPRLLRNISIPGVVIGATTDIVATNLLALPLVLPIVGQLGAHATQAQQRAALTDAFTNSPSTYLTGMALGSLASILGGWVAARLARRAELLNGALSAIACVGLGVYGAIEYPHAASLWEHAAFFVLSPALGALGGTIGRRRNTRIAARTVNVVTDAPPVPIALAGGRRAVYVVNRVLAGLTVLGFLSFGLVGAYGYSQHQAPVMIGAAIFCTLGLVAIALLVVAGRMLRAGRSVHWAYHGGGLLVAAIPFVVIAIQLTGARR